MQSKHPGQGVGLSEGLLVGLAVLQPQRPMGHQSWFQGLEFSIWKALHCLLPFIPKGPMTVSAQTPRYLEKLQCAPGCWPALPSCAAAPSHGVAGPQAGSGPTASLNRCKQVIDGDGLGKVGALPFKLHCSLPGSSFHIIGWS